MGELIRKLREITGAGFVDCKKALEATNNNIDLAIEWLQKNGAAKAIKKASNIAAEGLVNIVQNDKIAVIYEINTQTDFVAMNNDFKKLVHNIGKILLKSNFNTLEDILKLKDGDGNTIEDLTTNATAVIGEKISFRRAIKVDVTNETKVGSYVHFDGKKAALFVANGGSKDNLKGIAMHVTAMNPEYLNPESVPKNKIDQLKEEYANSPVLKNKPENIRESIMSGMLRKALSENVLTEQDYVVETGKKIEQYLKEINAKEIAMYRFEVGEGIEKNEVNFAEEVAAQMKK